MFYKCTNFDSPVEFKNTDKVLFAMGTFDHCTNFNQPISIPQNARDIEDMFYKCYKFNQKIVAKLPHVHNMKNMFFWCKSFNSDIDIYCPKCTNINYMFYRCKSLCANIKLYTPNLKSAEYSFVYTAINRFPDFQCSNIKHFRDTFGNCQKLNDFINIDISNGEVMSYLFNCCKMLNKPIRIKSNVQDIDRMYRSCYLLNQPSQFDESNNYNYNHSLKN